MKLICVSAHRCLFDTVSMRAPISLCIFDLLSFEAYREVNEIFALKTMEAVRRMNVERAATNGPTPIVWIHDYHLMLAANTLR